MKYVCDVCGWIYDEAETGVKWEDLPEDLQKHREEEPIWQK